MKDHPATLTQQQFDQRMQHAATELPLFKASLSVGPCEGWFVLNVANMGAPIYEVNVSSSPFPIRDSRDSTTKLSIHLPQLGVNGCQNDLPLFSAKIAVDKETNDGILLGAMSGLAIPVNISYRITSGLLMAERFKLILGLDSISEKNVQLNELQLTISDTSTLSRL